MVGGYLGRQNEASQGPKIASHHRGWQKRKRSRLRCANPSSGRLFSPLLESLLVHVRCGIRSRGCPYLVDLGQRYMELPVGPFTLKVAESGLKAASVSINRAPSIVLQPK